MSKSFASLFGGLKGGIVVVAAALFVGVAVFVAYSTSGVMEREARNTVTNAVMATVGRINKQMTEVEDVTKRSSVVVREHLDDPDYMYVFTENFVRSNAFILGSTVAFEPNYFKSKGFYYAPYTWQEPDGSLHCKQLGNDNNHYHEQEWYSLTLAARKPLWSEPYFDEGGCKVMMSTFSVPLMDEDGKVYAIFTADVGLTDLSDYVRSISPYPESYALLFSAGGNPLVEAPDSAQKLFDTVTVKGKADNGWTVELVCPLASILRDTQNLSMRIVLFAATCLAFIFLLSWFFSSRIEREHKRLEQEAEMARQLAYDIEVQREAQEKRVRELRAAAARDQLLAGITQSIYGFNVTVNLENLEFSVIRGTGMEHAVDLFESSHGYQHALNRIIEVVSEEDIGTLKDLVGVEALERRSKAGESGFIGAAEYLVKDFDGSFKWHEINLFLGEDSNGDKVANILGRDVTNAHEKAVIEAELEVTKRASEEKSKFLFNMSHDIRTPMNAIIGFNDMAAKYIDDKERVLDCQKKIHTASELLLTLINDILDMSRIESGKVVLSESPCDVRIALADVKPMLMELAKNKDINLSFEEQEIRNYYVYVDTMRTNRILMNIISNAIKYTAAGGWVKAIVRQLPDEKPGYGLYEFTVADNGIGMSEEFMKHIFEAFAREENSTVSGIQGTGLGLSLCKKLVELMHGTITVDSTKGKGSSFNVRLPFRLQNANEIKSHELPVEANNGYQFTGKNVLLVEDNELNREIAEEILLETGLSVDSAENGRIAVDKIVARGIDYYNFVLMDIQMPEMNGYEATVAIRKLPDGDKLPIIALSANAFEEDKQKSLAVGMNAHIAKPIRISELMDAIKSCIPTK